MVGMKYGRMKGKEEVVLSSVYRKSRGPLIYIDGVEL